MPLTFDEFWKTYPRRKGPNPKAPARTKWDKAVRDGAEPEQIINSAKAYADELREQGQLETEFVCQAKTWLNQKRWEDYEPDKERAAKADQFMASRGWKWDGHEWVKKEENKWVP